MNESPLTRGRSAPSQTLVTALFLALFTSGGMLYTLGAAVGSALFISSLPLRDVPRIVPWVYVGASVANVATALIYDRLLGRMSRMSALLVTQLSLGLLFSGAMLLWVQERPSHYYVLTIGLDAASLLSLTLFFGFAGDYFNAREARRIYGLVAGGIAVGTIMGGHVLSSLIPLFGVPNLVHVCAALLVFNACLCVLIARTAVPVPTSGSQAGSEQDVSLRVLLSHRYVRLVWLTFPLGMLLTVASAFQMQWLASEKPRAELAEFLGQFYAWVGAAELGFQFLLVPLLLRVLGVLGALMLPPLLVGAASWVMQSVSAVNYLGGTPLGYSAAVNGVRLTLEETLSLPARELLFLPLPGRLRSRAQTLAGAVLAPLTRGLAGVLLLFYVGAGFGIEHLSLVVIICSVALLIVFVRMRVPYRQALFDSLRASGLGGTDLSRLFEAQGADAILAELLKSSDQAVVLFTLELIGERRMPSLVPIVRPLAVHGDTDVSARAIEFLGAQGDPGVLPVIELGLESPRMKVASAATLAYARLAGPKAREKLLPQLDSPRVLLTQATLVALAQYAGAHDDVLPRVAALLSAEDRAERLRGIALIERIALPAYGELLIELVHTTDAGMRRAAAAAATKAGASGLLTALIERVRRGELAPSALARLGTDALNPLAQALAGPLTPAQRRLLLRCVAEIAHPDALAMVAREVDSSPDVLTRASAAECVRRLSAHETPSPDVLAHLESVIERECTAVEALFEARAALASREPEVAMLCADHARLRLEIVLSLCGLHVAHDELERMRASLGSRSLSLRAGAAELLDAALPRRLANRVGPCLNASLNPAAAEGKDLAPSLLGTVATLGPWASALIARYAHKRGEPHERWLDDPDARTMFERLSDVLFLKKVALFQGLPGDYLYELAILAEPVHMRESERLFERGDDADALYLVCEGAVSVWVEHRKVAQLTPGEPLGELALLDGETRSAAAVADGETRLLRLDSQSFQTLLETEPTLRRSLLATLYARLRGLRTSTLSGRESRHLSLAPRRAQLGIGELVSVMSILREAELFRDLPQSCLIKLATCAHPEPHFEGEVVYAAGAPAEAFYIVCSGTVGLVAGSTLMERLERGSCFGESALVARDPLEHSVRVLADAQVLRFSSSELNQLFDTEPDVGVAMLRHFASRLRMGTAQRVAQ